MKKHFSFFSRFLSKRNKHTTHALAFLNISQFLSVLNDNMFKLFLVFLLIDKLGASHASTILSLAGAVYVIPFLLFSYLAGILADKWSKQRLLVFMKVGEILIMATALFAFGWKREILSYVLLFLLATHSALLGPPKYGIIPELFAKEKVAKANSLITASTYLAVILGTFLASFITDISNRNFVVAAAFCFLIAVSGWVTSRRIPYTEAQGSKKHISWLFVSEIMGTLRKNKGIKHLIMALWGAAFFLFIGAFVQLNIIPFAIQDLHLSELAGGYLFLAVALGIAGGAFLSGKILKKQVDLSLSCLASFVLAILFFLLFLNSHSLPFTIVCLVLLGISGGVFIVPFDIFIQLQSPQQERGQVIAAGNFLSFSGVLLASLCLFLFNDVLKLSPAESFALMGAFTLIAFVFLFKNLSGQTLSYLSKKILFRICPLSATHIEFISPDKLLILNNASWTDCFFLLGYFPYLHFIIPVKKVLFRHRIIAFLCPFSFCDMENKKEYPEGTCLVLHKHLSQDVETTLSKDIETQNPKWKRVLHIGSDLVHVAINTKNKTLSCWK